MKITCPSCGNPDRFLVPLWVRVTFKFEDSGAISILHVRPLESLEEKIVDQGQAPQGLAPQGQGPRQASPGHFSAAITCQECGAAAGIQLNEYESLSEQERQQKAVEQL